LAWVNSGLDIHSNLPINKVLASEFKSEAPQKTNLRWGFG